MVYIEFQRSPQSSYFYLLPCLKQVISSDYQLYLYENTAEPPLEFKQGDTLGMLLRPERTAMLQPYFISTDTFVSFYRTGSFMITENLLRFKQDNMMPLLFLHVCKSLL